MDKEEFKQIRIDLGFSQQKMAEFIGIKSGRSIRRYESGDWDVPKGTAEFLNQQAKGSDNEVSNM